jgi:hypothetical protein
MYKKMMREETIGSSDSEQLQAQISKYEETVKTYEATLEAIRLESSRDTTMLKSELEESSSKRSSYPFAREMRKAHQHQRIS